MSNYYREFNGWLAPVEVDEWHPASQSPTPEDFGPSGQINIIDQMSCRTSTVYVEELKEPESGWTHWRRVTPPKP